MLSRFVYVEPPVKHPNLTNKNGHRLFDSTMVPVRLVLGSSTLVGNARFRGYLGSLGLGVSPNDRMRTSGRNFSVVRSSQRVRPGCWRTRSRGREAVCCVLCV